MSNNVNGKIASLVLRAQNASDGGKHMSYFYNTQKGVTDNRASYAQKDRLIIAAINIINRGKSNYKYAVVECNDFTNPAFIVYFQTRIECENIQVSFHSFNHELSKFVKNSYRIKWDHECSRDSAVYAYRYYTNGLYA